MLRQRRGDVDHAAALSYAITGVPDGAPEGLKYRLEHARLALRQGDTEGAEAIIRRVVEEAAEYGLATLQALSRALNVPVTAGPTGHGGVGLNGPAETIAHGRVTVPAACWKVIVVLPETGGGSDLCLL